MSDYQEISDKYYKASSETITAEYDVKRVLRYVYQAGFEQGVGWANDNEIGNPWHRKTKDGWTDWTLPNPPNCDDLIVTVYEDNCYYTTSAWFLDGYWIKDNDILNGVVAWKDFPKPCKEK